MMKMMIRLCVTHGSGAQGLPFKLTHHVSTHESNAARHLPMGAIARGRGCSRSSLTAKCRAMALHDGVA